MTINPIYVVLGRVHDDIIDIIIHTFKQCFRRCTLSRGPCLSPISRDGIELVSRFGSIVVKCQPIGVYGI